MREAEIFLPTKGKARSVRGNPHCAGEMLTTDVLLAQEIVMR